MPKEITYSIIIPVYNREKTLSRCLESLVSQKRDDVQILVIDDGSIDGSGHIAQEYAATYKTIQYFHQKNTGVSMARNLGLEYAVGKYITFVDSDDYVSRDYFHVLDQYTSTNTCDMLVFQKAGFGGDALDETLWFAEMEKLNTIDQQLQYLMSCRLIMHPVNKCFKNSVIQQKHIRFIQDIHIGEDFIFCMTYAMQCRNIVIDDAILYYYDLSDKNSLSRKYRANLCQQMTKVYQHINQIIKNNGPYCNQKHFFAVLDYLYIKNVFSCISEEFKQGKLNYFHDRKRIVEICQHFQQPLSDVYCNSIHRILRLALRLRLYFPFYWISYMVKGRKYRT